MNTLNTYPTELLRGSKKFICPSCGERKFVPEVFTGTADFINERLVGKCERINSCGYHYTAKQYFAENPDKKQQRPENSKYIINQGTAFQQSPIEYVSIDYVEKSMQGFKTSHFAKFIITLLGETVGTNILEKYRVGRSKNDNGKACLFWQIDEANNVRYGKIMCYDATSGKRRKDISPVKVPVVPQHFLQTFFGCHLLAEYPNKPVAIVESEKTAIIASFFMPQYNWLATGGASGCKWGEYQVYKVLNGKEVVLFPDFGYFSRPSSKPQNEWETCFDKWSDKAASIAEKMQCKITVSKVLENALTEDERLQGSDIADFLIKQDAQTGIALTDDNYPAIWDYKEQAKSIDHAEALSAFDIWFALHPEGGIFCYGKQKFSITKK